MFQTKVYCIKNGTLKALFGKGGFQIMFVYSNFSGTEEEVWMLCFYKECFVEVLILLPVYPNLREIMN